MNDICELFNYNNTWLVKVKTTDEWAARHAEDQALKFCLQWNDKLVEVCLKHLLHCLGGIIVQYTTESLARWNEVHTAWINHSVLQRWLTVSMVRVASELEDEAADVRDHLIELLFRTINSWQGESLASGEIGKVMYSSVLAKKMPLMSEGSARFKLQLNNFGFLSLLRAW